ncbi:hypothetical protein EGT74_17420 [Chitinophaga lutea]|uniref:DUF7674 domain-containing protein n=1 Tax=Chitinophaga lutea TaxID=2488634 RepID=A0A3N4PYQ5_9BACT|nr:hypothetical protein [Chitinophaga lutea]RPE08810.1 hypothetical protein EGT74_17420 [Chitinophaga lutea]
MSTWRRKAMACLPGLKKEIEVNDFSIYDFFIELLPATIAAHRVNDTVRLTAYYAFSEWCFRQKAKDLWNAAAVAFYEHLGDQPETLGAMPQWVPASIYNDIRGLLALRLDHAVMKELDKAYK